MGSLNDADGNRLLAKMLFLAKSQELIVVLKEKLTMAAVKTDVLLLAECDGSTVRLVESEGVVLAEILLQELLGDFSCHIDSPYDLVQALHTYRPRLVSSIAPPIHFSVAPQRGQRILKVSGELLFWV